MFNPFANNRFQTREDFAQSVRQLVEPLIPAFSAGGARVKLSAAGACFPAQAAELEGFARPLWGIVPLVYGGGHFAHWELYRKGVSSGTDPENPEYWGDPQDYDQRLVELAAFGFALCFVPEHFWEPLLEKGKQDLANYLLKARVRTFAATNWMFFRVLIDMGLENVGIEVDLSLTEAYLDKLDALYLADGWYGDGRRHRIDYYNGFAHHYYGLIYSVVRRKTDPKRAQKMLERARLFAHQFVHWFADDGSLLPYGRLLTYRFAAIAFWGMVPLAFDEPPLPWETVKGIYTRHMQWWAQQPVSQLNTGILSVGYSFPNLVMSERYNLPQLPYWAMKAFGALMVPDSHPFWKADAAPLQLEDTVLPTVGMLFSHRPENTVVLVSGPWNDEFPNDKYTKFAYSTRLLPGVRYTTKVFSLAHLDNTLAFSFNQVDYYVRERHRAWTVKGGLFLEWVPTKDISVRTWLLQHGDYHVRVHQVQNNSSQAVYTVEGGFAVGAEGAREKVEGTLAEIALGSNVSAISDLGGVRTAEVATPEPNTNMGLGRVVLPQLKGEIAGGGHVTYICAVYGQKGLETPFAGEAWLLQISVPTEKQLEALLADRVRVVCNEGTE